MEKYLNNLFNQFKNATGIKYIDVDSEKFREEFYEWVKSRKSMGYDYTDFIDYMEVYPNVINDGSIEIGKGKYDSIALDSYIQMITPYSKGIKKAKPGIITADFKVSDGVPKIIKPNKTGSQIEVFNTDDVSRFLTHNPYNQECINNWEQLHNAGENITVGVFGSIYDKDMAQKIKQIENLRDSLEDYIEEYYTTYNNNYYYVVSSSAKVKKLVKTYYR